MLEHVPHKRLLMSLANKKFHMICARRLVFLQMHVKRWNVFMMKIKELLVWFHKFHVMTRKNALLILVMLRLVNVFTLQSQLDNALELFAQLKLTVLFGELHKILENAKLLFAMLNLDVAKLLSFLERNVLHHLVVLANLPMDAKLLVVSHQITTLLFAKLQPSLVMITLLALLTIATPRLENV
jgi:hypothetical protein